MAKTRIPPLARRRRRKGRTTSSGGELMSRIANSKRFHRPSMLSVFSLLHVGVLVDGGRR